MSTRAFGVTIGGTSKRLVKSSSDVRDRDISSHSRRKQDDEILAELERDTQASGNGNRGNIEDGNGIDDSIDGLSQLHLDSLQERLGGSAASNVGGGAHQTRRKRDGPTSQEKSERTKEKTYTTSLPREDAHRFRATIDEAVERLDLLGLITADSLRRRKDPGTSRTRKDIFTLMRREQELEKMYEQLMHRRNELRGLSNKSKYLQNQSELSEITAALKQSTSSITANLKDHPTIVGNLNKIQKDRASLNQLLQLTSDELKEENYHGSSPASIAAQQAQQQAQAAAALQASQSGGTNTVPMSGDDLNPDLNGVGGGVNMGGYTPSYSYDTLVEQVTRRSEEQRLLIETKLRQEKTSEALKKLQTELENEWLEYEKLEDSKNAQILDLTQQLKHLKKVTGLTVKYEQQTSIAHKETIDRLRANRLSELKASIARTKADLKTDKRVNKKSLVFLAKQKDAMDALYEEWEQNYNHDYGAKSREYEELTFQRSSDQQKLVSQQNRWYEDSRSKIALMKEMSIRAQEEEAYRALMDRMYLAQCTIRFYWRVYWRIRKKELKKLKKKQLARLRAKRKAEKNRPPQFGRKSEPTTDNEEEAGGGGGASKPQSAGPTSKQPSAPGSAKPSAR